MGNDTATGQTVGDYLIERLQAYGIDHIFGVPGDFVLAFMQRVEASDLKLITTSDEQGAGFAADAYARLRGMGAVAVTYGVGGLKVANCAGQAFAEQSAVVFISGAPGVTERQLHPLIHHKVRSFDSQYVVFQELTCHATVLDDPTTAAHKIDRALDAARTNSRPVYIELPRDVEAMPVTRVEPPIAGSPLVDQEMFDVAVRDAVAKIAAAKRPLVIAGVELARFDLIDQAIAFAERNTIPIAESLLSKSVIPETHPNFIGVYAGEMSRPEIRDYVESCDCVILLGEVLSDLNLGSYTAKVDPSITVHASRDRMAIGRYVFQGVPFEAFVERLCLETFPARGPFTRPAPPEPSPPGDPDAPVTSADVFDALGGMLTDQYVVIADPGDALFGSIHLPIHAGREFLAPAYYASLGFAVPAAVGAQFARPDLRPIVLVGDGAFQMTGQELSTAVRYGQDPIVILFKNGGYATERLIGEGDFNDITPWNHTALVDLLGSGLAFDVKTRGDLDRALAEAVANTGQYVLLEVELAPLDVSPALSRLGARLHSSSRG